MAAWEMVEYYGRLYRDEPDVRQWEERSDGSKLNASAICRARRCQTGMKQKVSSPGAITRPPGDDL